MRFFISATASTPIADLEIRTVLSDGVVIALKGI